MKKNLVTIGIAGVLVVSAGLIFVASKKSDQKQVNNNQNQSQQEEIDDTYINSDGKTLGDFMSGSLGQNVVCEFSYGIAKTNSLNGVAYIAGDKLRVDYELKNEVDGQKDLHMISDGEYGYVWGNSIIGRELQGTKFRVDTEGQEEGQEEVDNTSEYLDYDAPMANCRIWNPDMTLFEIPEDIEFMDMEELQNSFGEGIISEEMMQQAQEESNEEEEGEEEGSITMDCSVCDSMPEAQRAICLEGMGCEE